MCAFGVVAGAGRASRSTGRGRAPSARSPSEHDITVVVGMFTPAAGGRVRNTLLATGRGVDASVRQDPPVRRLRLPRVQDGRRRQPARRGRDRRRDGRSRHLLRRALSRAVPDAGPSRRADHRACRRRGAPGRASASSGTCCAGTGAGQHGLRARPAIRRTRWPPEPRDAAPRPPESVASAVVSPLGVVVDQLGPAPGMLVADIDPGEADDARVQIPVLANRRF